jgi:hypothetical protein
LVSENAVPFGWRRSAGRALAVIEVMRRRLLASVRAFAAPRFVDRGTGEWAVLALEWRASTISPNWS